MKRPASVGSARASAVSDAVAALSRLSLAPAELVHEAEQRIRSVVPCDLNRWWTVDPETILATELGRRAPRARGEEIFSSSDFAIFDRLDRDGSESTAAGNDLHLACRSGGSTWLVGHLQREADGPAFTQAEVQYIVGLGGYVAAGVRSYLVDAPWVPVEPVVPSIVSVDAEEGVLDATPEGVDWLRRLGGGVEEPLPPALHGLVRQTRERRVGPPPLRAAKVRIRLPEGTWIVARAHKFAVTEAHTAILIKAATRADLRGFYLSVHGLTRRERELTELLIEGKDLQEVATILHLSIHTVRSHVKAIFAKVDVGSRAELTAALT